MIAIVGAGITGLSLAWLLREKGLEVRLFEAGDRVGGNIRSHREAGCLLELGPNSLRLNDFLYHFLERLDLTGDLVHALPQAKHRYILRNGAYRKLPTGPISLTFNRFLSFNEKRRILRERRIPAGTDPQESVDAFFRRRFGDTTADYLVAPFISGIYAGDPRQLLIAEAFPRLRQWEQEYGSVIRGAMRGRSKNRHKGIVSFREGLEMLPLRLAQLLGGGLETGAPVQQVEPGPSGIRLIFRDGREMTAEKVILTVPAHAAAALVEGFDREAATAFRAVPYPPVALVHSLYRWEDLGHPLDGFGGLNNQLEGRFTLGTIFSSSTFEGRAPEGTALLTSFVGGAVQPDHALAPENEICEKVREELEDLLGIRGEPLHRKCTLYERAIPQYTPEALPSREQARKLEGQGLVMGGNWIGGISVVACIERAHELCAQLAAGHG